MFNLSIAEIDINGFRGIFKCDQPIKLSKFNVLIGRNNSAKSALLEALFLFPSPNIDSFYGNRKPMIHKLHSGVLSLLYGYVGTVKIHYKINDTDLGVEFDHEQGLKVIMDNKENPNEDTIAEMLKLSVDELRKFSIYIPYNTELLKQNIDVLKNRENELVATGANVKIANFLNQCLTMDKLEKFFNLNWDPRLLVEEFGGENESQ